MGGAADVAGSGDWGGISGLFSGATSKGAIGLGEAASPVFLRCMITVTAIGPSFWCYDHVRSVIHLLCNCRLAPCALVILYWLHSHYVADFQLWKILSGSVVVLCLFKLMLV